MAAGGGGVFKGLILPPFAETAAINILLDQQADTFRGPWNLHGVSLARQEPALSCYLIALEEFFPPFAKSNKNPWRMHAPVDVTT